MATRRVGKLGEKELARWAAQVDIIANPASDDRRGWDYLLEMPLIESSLQSSETRSTEDYQCFLQVKSTRGRRRSRSVKLSNWKRLIETALPAFFLILRFNDKDECIEAYLKHVWKEEITRLDQKIWELAMSRQPLHLHKQTMQLRWGEEDRLLEPSGSSLMDRIAHMVGKSPTSYAKAKAELKETSGHGPGRSQATVRIAVPDEYKDRPEELMVDHVLGLKSPLELLDGEITHVRFSVPERTTHALTGRSRLVFGPSKPSAHGELVLSTSDRKEAITLPADMRVPSGLGYGISLSAMKVLFSLPYAKLVYSANTTAGTFYFSLPGLDEKMRMDKAMHLARLIRLVQRAAQEDLQIDVSFKGDDCGYLRLHNMSLEDDFLRWATLTHIAYEACTQFGLPLDTNITTRSLLEQHESLNYLALALPGGNVAAPTFTFSLNETALEPPKGTNMCVPIHVDLALGTKRIVVFESVIGRYEGARTASGDCVVRVDRGEIDISLKLKPDEDLPKDRSEYLTEIGAKRAEEGHVLCWWAQDCVTSAPDQESACP